MSLTRRLGAEDRGVRDLHIPGEMQAVAIVSEPGMYSAVLRSQAPNASEFKRWVTREVLPTIRRTGAYSRSEVNALPQSYGEALLHGRAEVFIHGWKAEGRVQPP